MVQEARFEPAFVRLYLGFDFLSSVCHKNKKGWKLEELKETGCFSHLGINGIWSDIFGWIYLMNYEGRDKSSSSTLKVIELIFPRAHKLFLCHVSP